VVGYITRGRGVTIHRADCSNVLRWQGEEAHRLLDVHWGERAEQRFRVGVQLLAYDRRELFKDISSVMASAEVPVTDISSHLEEGGDRMDVRLQVEVRNYEQLSELLTRLGAIRNVIETRRLREAKG
jgi:GTP pyrophosphokinase